MSLAAGVGLAAVGLSPAAVTTWQGPSTIASSAEVNTQGTLVMARQETYTSGGGYADQTVNGVTFSGTQNTQNGVTLSLSGQTANNQTTFISTKTLAGPDAAAYQKAIAGAWYGTTSPVTLALSGLTVGHDYLVQIWAADFRQYTNARTETVTTPGGADINPPILHYLTGNGSSAGSGTGEFVVGTFTADATNIAFRLTGNESSQLNAFQLRDLTPVPTAGGWASATNLVIGQTIGIAVTVTNGASTNIVRVVLDANAMGVMTPVMLLPAGGNVFTNAVTVSSQTFFGAQTLWATVTDGDGLQGRAGIAVVVPAPPAYKALPESLESWRSNRFGMFIHWGPVSLTGLEISWSRANSNPACPNNGPTPVAVYDNLYTNFIPTGFDASNWVAVAQAAGMKYIVLTAKHCDGFLLWDSQASDYNIMHSPFGRDVCGELAAAAHAAGMKIGWYFSPMDWKDPRFRTAQNADFVQDLKAELRELLTKYGTIDLLWFDTDGYSNPYDVTNTYAMCRNLQPGIVIDNRLDMGSMADYNAQAIGPWADYYTPEQRIGEYDDARPWETCMTIGTQWAWKTNDTIKSYPECMNILLRCAGGDGNLLFNLGPMPDGRFELPQSVRIAEMGAWLAQHGESVYGTRGGPYKPTTTIASTRRDRDIYIHLLSPRRRLTLSPLPTNIVSATVLTGGDVSYAQSTQSVVLQLSAEATNRPIATVKLTLAGSAMGIPARDAEPALPPLPPLPTGTVVTASNHFQSNATYAVQMAVDRNSGTRWACDTGVTQAWVTFEFPQLVRVSSVGMSEAYDRVEAFRWQYLDETNWVTFLTGTYIGAAYSQDVPPITARKLRFDITQADDGPSFWEIGFTYELVPAYTRTDDPGSGQVQIDVPAEEVVLAESLGGMTSLVKTGSGTLALLDPAGHSGATRILGGALRLVPPSLAPVTGAARWFDASILSLTNDAPVAQWDDRSEGGYHATPRTGHPPNYRAAALGGLGVVSFAAGAAATNSQSLNFTRDASIRTVFSVFKGASFLLTDTNAYDFHRPDDTNAASPLWSATYASASIRGGSTRVNGETKDGTAFAMPTNLHGGFNLVEVETTGGVRADGFNRDRTYHSGAQQHAEVMLYDRKLTEIERRQNERYLQNKWFGLAFPEPAYLPTNSAVSLESDGASFDLSGATATIGSLAGVAGGRVMLGGGALLIAGDATPATFAGRITGTGSLVNNGTLRLVGHAELAFAGAFTNHGVLDIMTWSGALPAGFVNHGVVLDHSQVRLRSAAAGNDFRLTIDGHLGHTYQLLRADILGGSWVGVGHVQTGAGVTLLFTDVGGGSSTSRFYGVGVQP